MRARWLSRRSLLLHLALVIWVPGCIVAAWWQVTVALGGNGLAYLYSVEWPCFAIFGIVFWWNLIHDDPESVGARGLVRARRVAAAAGRATAGTGDPRSAGDAGDAGEEALPPEVEERIREVEVEDPELKAYNEYLERLAHEHPPSGWRRR